MSDEAKRLCKSKKKKYQINEKKIYEEKTRHIKSVSELVNSFVSYPVA